MAFIVSEHGVDYDVDGEVLATLSFKQCGEDMVEIDHTFVHDSLRGQGIASKLMQHAAEELRRRKVLVLPTCSYAAKWLFEHDEYSDLLRD